MIKYIKIKIQINILRYVTIKKKNFYFRNITHLTPASIFSSELCPT